MGAALCKAYEVWARRKDVQEKYGERRSQKEFTARLSAMDGVTSKHTNKGTKYRGIHPWSSREVMKQWGEDLAKGVAE